MGFFPKVAFAASSRPLAEQAAVRKLRMNVKGSVLYSEAEDALNRYCRLLEADMQKFATLHETLQDAAETKALPHESRKTLTEGMREIAVVLLACGEMQRRALDLKMGAQRSIADSFADTPPLVSFAKFADFLEKALAVSDQLRRKHEELQQQRMRAMASVAEARCKAQRQDQSSQAAHSASPRKPSSGITKVSEKAMLTVRSAS